MVLEIEVTIPAGTAVLQPYVLFTSTSPVSNPAGEALVLSDVGLSVVETAERRSSPATNLDTSRRLGALAATPEIGSVLDELSIRAKCTMGRFIAFRLTE